VINAGVGWVWECNYSLPFIVNVIISCSGRSAGEVEDVFKVSPEDGESSQGAVLTPAG